jgi:hypothetical protein
MFDFAFLFLPFVFGSILLLDVDFLFLKDGFFFLLELLESFHLNLEAFLSGFLLNEIC